LNINEKDLSIKDKTFYDYNNWDVKKDYGIPYRCIRDKAGWE
jgi:hypothetical protein